MLKSQRDKLKKLNGLKIALLGWGLDNQSLLALLDKEKIKAQITICDFRDKEQLPPVRTKHLRVAYQLGASFNTNLDRFDCLFRSPGWPIACPGIQAALKTGHTELNSPMNLFFYLAPTKNIIGITGSKGKGTTASLIYQILLDSNRHNKKKVWLGGNIGVSPLSFLEKIKAGDFVILELSSFQLEDLRYSPRLALITNLFPEHLAPADPHNPNFHASRAAYWRAKLNIASHGQNEYLIVSYNLKNKMRSVRTASKIIYFRASRLASHLAGEYNRENIGAAVAAAKILKIKPDVYRRTIASFHNLEHRLELVAEIKGVRYFDNSFSTTPESTVLDLKSFRAPVILIAGGADKGASFRFLARTIRKRVKFLILLDGRATPRIKKELTVIRFPRSRMRDAKSMAEAVSLARAQSVPGDIVLLSTACASFGLFKNYKERGDQFKYYVRAGI